MHALPLIGQELTADLAAVQLPLRVLLRTSPHMHTYVHPSFLKCNGRWTT